MRLANRALEKEISGLVSFERFLEFFLGGTFRRNPGESMGTTKGKGVAKEGPLWGIQTSFT